MTLTGCRMEYVLRQGTNRLGGIFVFGPKYLALSCSPLVALTQPQSTCHGAVFVTLWIEFIPYHCLVSLAALANCPCPQGGAEVLLTVN